MEFVEGETLESLIKRSGRLDMKLALEITTQVAFGLAAVHKDSAVQFGLREVLQNELGLEMGSLQQTEKIHRPPIGIFPTNPRAGESLKLPSQLTRNSISRSDA
jgi:serine/threonine protein kinase